MQTVMRQRLDEKKKTDEGEFETPEGPITPKVRDRILGLCFLRLHP